MNNTTFSTNHSIHKNLDAEPILTTLMNTTPSTTIRNNITQKDCQSPSSSLPPCPRTTERTSSPSQTASSGTVDICFTPPQSSLVQLVKGRDICVEGGALRKALASSNKKKDPLKLIYKLMPLVFSDQTLASSCGFSGKRQDQAKSSQGLLDGEAIECCKTYVLAWSKSHGVPSPSDSQLNRRITNAIQDSRKRLNRKLSL